MDLVWERCVRHIVCGTFGKGERHLGKFLLKKVGKAICNERSVVRNLILDGWMHMALALVCSRMRRTISSRMQTKQTLDDQKLERPADKKDGSHLSPEIIAYLLLKYKYFHVRF